MSSMFTGRVTARGPDAPELVVECRSEGRAGAGSVENTSGASWCAATGDFVLAEGRLADWARPQDRAALVGRVVERPRWPFRSGDGGTLAAAAIVGQEFFLFGDALGSLPLYYAEVDGALYFSSRLLDLEIPHKRLDPVGVLELIGLETCVGQRTVLDGVRCLPPGRTLCWTPASGARLLDRDVVLWRERRSGSSRRLIAEMAERLSRAADRVCTAMGDARPGVMLGGLDSRVVVQLLQDRGAAPVVAVTYGRAGIPETDSARAFAEAFGVPHVVQDLGPDDVGGPDLWRRLLHETGVVAHPHWDRAAGLLEARGAQVSFAGSLGDLILGGSLYKYPPRTRARLMLGLDWGVEQPADRAYLETLVQRQLDALGQSGWRVPLEDTLIDKLRALWSEVERDLRTVAESYLGEGMPEAQQVLERFVMEHRVRHVVSAQERTLSRHLPVLSPFLDVDLMTFGFNLMPKKRAERRLLSGLVRSRFPRVASFPVPNSLFPHSAPPALILLGKVLRKRRAARNTRRYASGGGQFSEGGWPSAWDPLLRSEPVLALVGDYLSNEVFDGEKTDRYLGNLAGGGGWVGTGRSLLRFVELQALLEAVGSDGFEI